ncbi:hypothetical protein R1sor_009600 [Riccia sorocarpa]|uniref:Uncharacterized protein n=1 Tax=Riccia sorocarpa TaxID=122646 RepID=A0ABD3I1P9_9MARC
MDQRAYCSEGPEERYHVHATVILRVQTNRGPYARVERTESLSKKELFPARDIGNAKEELEMVVLAKSPDRMVSAFGDWDSPGVTSLHWSAHGSAEISCSAVKNIKEGNIELLGEVDGEQLTADAKREKMLTWMEKEGRPADFLGVEYAGGEVILSLSDEDNAEGSCKVVGKASTREEDTEASIYAEMEDVDNNGFYDGQKLECCVLKTELVRLNVTTELSH